ncbi:MAG TPA: aminotransferase class V-fold PLP-dependent enzyme [Thermoanaerobaculia bacterium]|nr:aminotransferase class V-fold PLP-dependent enzyme [Thermoanaerobaculia bacterium]
MSKWNIVREAFELDPAVTHFAAMSLVAHPAVLKWEIDSHRNALNRWPLMHVSTQFPVAEEAAFEAVATYFCADASSIALTGSTTMGLAQVLGGVAVAPHQEILTSTADHSSTLDTLELRKRRDGTAYRTFRLYKQGSTATAAEIVDNVRAAIRPETRLLSLAWVYSSDGLKIPVRNIAKVVKAENACRHDPSERLLFSIDGVHGFGVEDSTFDALGCDLFIAGCHKWVFGPRGTAIICGRPEAWEQVVPIVATFSARTKGPGRLHTPGGVHAYEHTLSLATSFHFLSALGKPSVYKRVRQLVERLRAGLTQRGMLIETPAAAQLSSGIVCFRHPEEEPTVTVRRLTDNKIHITESPEDPSGARHARVSVAIFNNEEDIDRLVNTL